MQITEYIHLLRIDFEVPLPGGPLKRFVNLYPLCAEEVWLIDAGVAGAEDAVGACLRELGRALPDLTWLVLTHAHPDHVGGAAALQRASGCSVAAHAAEQRWIEDVACQARERPVPGFGALVGGSVPLARVLEEGDLLSAGPGLTLEVLHTPGHSAGSLSLLAREAGALFTGDAVLSPGDLPIYDDPRLLDASLQRLQGLSGVEVMLSAWDEPRRGAEVGARLEAAREYLAKVGAAVRAAAPAAADETALCAAVVAELGLPAAAANPLVARSLAAHLREPGT